MPQLRRTILVIDDEPRIVNLIRMDFEREGFAVLGAHNAQEGLRKLTEHLPDAVILDVMLPEMDGYEVLRAIRNVSTVPVVMLTVRADEADKVRGLELGADDYVTKPFSQRELLSRVRAVLRRAELPAPPRRARVVVDDRLTIDFDRREVIVEGKPVSLRPTEYRLLYHLVANAGRVLTHETLLAKVWGHEYRDEDQYVRLYVTYLRQKIERDPRHPEYILNERGLGYRFRDLDPAAIRQIEPAPV
jgi:two-component system KDP operon response regulator KdpE